MKIIAKKSVFSIVGAMLMALGFTACTEWGDSDPEAGNQIYPERQVVATYDFEYSEQKPEYSDMLIHNEVCEVVVDDSTSSNVLHVSGAGGAKIANPFTSVKLQNGAAITFAVRAVPGEDGTIDLTRPLFSFGSDDENGARFYFTANGQLVYSKPGQLESLNLNENDPASYKTGIIQPNKWHFVALQLNTDGYQLYVDGKKSLSGTGPKGVSATTFSYQTLIDSLQTLPYLYIGTTGADFGKTDYASIYVDNFSFIRNQMIEKDWNKTVNTNGGGSNEDEKVYVNVGEDLTTGWWSAFSDYFTIPDGSSFHTTFINHTDKANNWHNWLLVVTTDAERGATGYGEHFVLRADNYAWFTQAGGNTIDNTSNVDCSIESNFNWDTFLDDMDGATVDMTVKHEGTKITVTANITTVDGESYYEHFSMNGSGITSGNVRAFLTVEGGYLQLDAADTYIGHTYESGSALVGNADFSSGWWSAFSDFYPMNSEISDDCPFVVQFVNNNQETNSNWNNWILVCSTEARGGSNYFENYVLRSDAYGWFGAGGNTNDNSANLDFSLTSSFDWTTYMSDMHGATCWLKFTRSGTSLTMNAIERKADGTYLPDYKFVFNSMKAGSAGIFLSSEKGSLDLLKVGYFPYFNKLFTDK